MVKNISPANLYRLPWTLPDNSITWLEPTSKCNIYCDGCYRENRKSSNKTLSEIEHELDVICYNRKTDSVSIAGGEPLLHPNIIEIIRMVKQKGWKPNVNTNGILLDSQFLKDLKKAGLHSLTIHIDSGQSRPGWKGKNELELNELRELYAMMINEDGGITLSFNSTVYPETIQYVPDLIEWAGKYSNYVHGMVFILYRMAVLHKDFDFYIGDVPVEFEGITYSKEDDNRPVNISSPELVDVIRQKHSEFEPCAYLNGTAKADSYKWLLACRFLNKHKVFGYGGPNYMEIIQTFKHLFSGTYLAYSTPTVLKRGRASFLLATFDTGIRNAVKNYFKTIFTEPKAFFNRVNSQTILIVQPGDTMPDGTVNMCDGCPDMTVFKDELVWSCRMEEQFRWGQNVRMVPKSSVVEEVK